MEALSWLLTIIVVIYLFYVMQPSKRRKSDPVWPSAAKPSSRAPSDKGREAWRNDRATQRQIEYIEELGGKVPSGYLTKGEASEIIDGLLPADEDDLAVLKFFKVSTKGLRQKSASEAVERLLSDPDKLARWKARPPSQEAREFFQFIGEKLPPKTGHDDANSLMRDRLKTLRSEDPEKAEEWDSYSSILDSLADRSFREDYEIRKPSMTLVKKVIAAMLSEGWTYKRIYEEEDQFIERLIEEDPAIERQGG